MSDDALARARAIAARLSGDASAMAPASLASPSAASGSATTSASTSAPTTKRKRWGVVANASEATPTEVLPGLTEASKRLKKSGEPISRRLWVSTTDERPEWHFFSYLPDRLTRLTQDFESSENAKVSISLLGRGSTKEPPLPGIPLEPMHVMIAGPTTADVEKVEVLVDSLLQEAEKAPVEGHQYAPPPSQSSADNATANSLALVNSTYGPGSGSSGYKPATVAQLIHSNTGGMGAGMGGGSTGGAMIEETMGVPNGIVGFLIGKGGETIASLQARSGCKVQIQKEHELQPGQTQRTITLLASSQDAVDQCRGMIERMVQERIRAVGGSGAAAGGGGGNSSKDDKVTEALSAGHKLVNVDVPDADVGLIIGKGGMTIRKIQESTGSSVQIPPSGNADNPAVRTISITHPHEQGALMAKQQIEEILSSKPGGGRGGGGGAGFGGDSQMTIQVMIPDPDVGLCIGRQGCVIKEMQQKTRTRIQIPSQSTPGHSHRVATVVGSPEGCNAAKALIEQISKDQSSACVMSGSGPQQSYQHGGQHFGNQSHYGQQQQQQRGGQDYSAEWQAYYAAQAVAQQQPQQAAVPAQSMTAAAPAPATTDTTYHEQFFRYAYYYGEEAARSHYGAWSPPFGTPNPYGVNPNGITPAPATAAPAPAPTPSPGPTPSPAPAQAQDVRDSSVRRVSNLPAWLIKQQKQQQQQQ